MRITSEDQTIGTRAIALLAGEQRASIDVHGAGQEGARLSLTWGTLLPGFSAAPSVGPCQRGRRKVGPAKPGTPRTRKETPPCLSAHRVACRVGASSARTPRRVGAVDPSVLLPAQDPPGGHSRGESGPGALVV